ncbi:MAG TPA: hypothetical protein VHA56_19490 [Mucilaginibacter sp.]|nr:hypothetical protein [Mucilaginibacter sp.]
MFPQKASVLFARNYYAQGHVVVNQGGTSSGKTFAILQALFCLACANAMQVITVAGQDIPNLKAGALRDALSIYHTWPEMQRLIKSYNRSDRIFEFHNGTGTMGQTGAKLGGPEPEARCIYGL